VEEVPGLGFHAHDHAHGPDLCPFLCHLLQLITNDSVLVPGGNFQMTLKIKKGNSFLFFT
jgi:hypothetical protein